MTETRERLPNRRGSWTQKAVVGGLTMHLGVGEYPDGRPGEVFINTDLHRCDDDVRALLNCFSIAVSLGLQHGVPLESLVGQFVGTRFNPGGPVQGSERVKLASSVLDWAFRELAIHYLDRDDLANVPAPEADGGEDGSAVEEAA